MRLVLDSPVGPLAVMVDDDDETVVGVQFGVPAGFGPAGFGPAGRHAAVDELKAYFTGDRASFSVPVKMVGGSDFERAVWTEIAKIPYGEMRTYGAIASALGDLGLARAVGTACNHNPVPVIVPCHRVVGAGGKMVGFGGGIDRKRRLLELEARVTLQQTWGLTHD